VDFTEDGRVHPTCMITEISIIASNDKTVQNKPQNTETKKILADNDFSSGFPTKDELKEVTMGLVIQRGTAKTC
jgi:hypothetical protein